MVSFDMRSAKDILRTHNFLQAHEKKLKYVKYEFQDYAFRLANDLGDTSNKMIYLRLAKSVDRTLLEQAASFALGYFDEINKGKLFMWKLKQLQEVTRTKRKLNNFEYHFVLNEMNEVLSSLAPSLIKKWQKEWNDLSLPLLKQVLLAYQNSEREMKARAKPQALLYSTRAGLDLNVFHTLDMKISGVELVEKFAGAAKASAGGKHVVRKPDPLAFAAPDSSADLIWVPQLWELISLEMESKALSIWGQKSKPNAILGLVLPASGNQSEELEKEEWKELPIGDQTILYYTKQNHLPNIQAKLTATDWKVLDTIPSGTKTLVIAQKRG